MFCTDSLLINLINLVANYINFSFALYLCFSICLKVILQSCSSLHLWYLLSVHLICFLSVFEKGYVGDFLLLLRGLTWVSFCTFIPNSFYCGIFEIFLSCQVASFQKCSFTCFKCMFCIGLCQTNSIKFPMNAFLADFIIFE